MMEDDTNPKYPWREFCGIGNPFYVWYSEKTDTATDDHELCVKDAKAGAPEAVKKLAEFAKFRMTQ